MLTNRGTARPALWGLVQAGALVLVAAITPSYAHAAGVGIGSCVGGARSIACAGQWAIPGDPHVRAVPDPVGEAAKAQAANRERRWLTRCQPIVEHDIYGVARYLYAAPGCEYGIGAD